MAIAIPLIVMAAGAGAAAAIGVSVATLAIGTGLVLQATGINAKINKAASKVFGEKLVNIANIAGSVFIGATAAGLIGGAQSAAGGLAGAAGSAAETAGAVAGDVGAAMNAAEMGAQGAAGVNSVSGGASAANQLASGVGVPPVGGGIQTPSVGGFDGALKVAKEGVGKVGEGISSAWNSMGDKTKAAALQIGGQMLSGASAGKAAEEAEKQRIANENRYRSGSGLSYWQNKPSYTPPGG